MFTFLVKAREKSRVHGAIGFGFASHWLKTWRGIFEPITKRSNCNHVSTFDSHLKTALSWKIRNIVAELCAVHIWSISHKESRIWEFFHCGVSFDFTNQTQATLKLLLSCFSTYSSVRLKKIDIWNLFQLPLVFSAKISVALKVFKTGFIELGMSCAFSSKKRSTGKNDSNSWTRTAAIVRGKSRGTGQNGSGQRFQHPRYRHGDNSRTKAKPWREYNQLQMFRLS